MKKAIGVFTSDKFLYQKIKLWVSDECEVRLGEVGDISLWDIDTLGAPKISATSMSRRGGADLSLPLSIDEISNLCAIGEKESLPLTLDESQRAAILRSEKIKLTEIEFSLLSAIYKRMGGYASREELLDEVWNGKADGGIINVYVHYLREKLEKYGEKIIVSSRKCGYKINEKYVGGMVPCSE